MANEPERPIEKLLRDRAKQRRDEAGPPFALHPADRRILQGEVARKYGPERAESGLRNKLRRLWPAFAWGVAVLAVLATGWWLVSPLARRGQENESLAANRYSQSSPSAVVSAPLPATPPPVAVAESAAAPAPGADGAARASGSSTALLSFASGPRMNIAGGSLQSDQEKSRRSIDSAGPAIQKDQSGASGGVPARTGAATDSNIVRSGPATKQDTANLSSLATNSPAPSIAVVPNPAATPAPPAGQVSLAAASAPPMPAVPPGASPIAAKLDSPGTDAIGRGQNFARVTPQPMSKTVPARKAASDIVLASFRVEQSGRELRIIDNDGSVYTGSLQLADAQLSPLPEARSATATPAAQPSVLSGAAPAVAPSTASVSESRRAHAIAPDDTVPVAANKAPMQNYFFSVAGTNLSLRQNVVFTGSFMTSSNLDVFKQPAAGGGFGGASDRAVQGKAVEPGLIPLTNSTITGKIQIGRRRAIDIRAVPSAP
jgi:hypothetical protein